MKKKKTMMRMNKKIMERKRMNPKTKTMKILSHQENLKSDHVDNIIH